MKATSKARPQDLSKADAFCFSDRASNLCSLARLFSRARCRSNASCKESTKLDMEPVIASLHLMNGGQLSQWQPKQHPNCITESAMPAVEVPRCNQRLWLKQLCLFLPDRFLHATLAVKQCWPLKDLATLQASYLNNGQRTVEITQRNYLTT